MKGLGLILLVGVLLFSASAGAIYVDDSQEDITLTMEQGSRLEFPLLVFSSKASDQSLFAYDDIEDWITFGVGRLREYDFTQDSYTLNAVRVTIDVPESAEVGKYNGGIASNGILSDITIKVVPPLDEIKSLQDLEVMKGELQDMADGISGELNDTKESLQKRIAEISQYQQNLTNLETELAELRERSWELEKTNTELSGQVVAGSPAQIVFGVLAGIIIVVLFLYRGKIGKVLRSSRPEAYRGWKPG